ELSSNELIFHTGHCSTSSNHNIDDHDDAGNDDDEVEDQKRILRGGGDAKGTGKETCNLPEDRLLMDDAVSLIVLNIPSYAGGSDIWSRADRWWNWQAVRGRSKDTLKGRCNFSDGKLDLLTYRDMLSFFLDIGFKIGNARRLYQGEGLFEFNFKKSTPTKRYYTYMQVDGEPLKVFNPDKAVIKFDRKIRVMVRKQE
ncbi:hypothetical protein FOZ62_026564, partial [Perkinsus olseni]